MIGNGPFLDIYGRKVFDIDGYIITFDYGECSKEAVGETTPGRYLAAGYVLHHSATDNHTVSEVKPIKHAEHGQALLEVANEEAAKELVNKFRGVS